MGEANRRKQTGAPSPKASSRKPLIIGVSVLILASIILGESPLFNGCP